MLFSELSIENLIKIIASPNQGLFIISLFLSHSLIRQFLPSTEVESTNMFFYHFFVKITCDSDRHILY